jgi:hypothetical protein
MFMNTARFAIIGLGTVLASVALCQPATPEQRTGVPTKDGYGTLHLETKLGSFKLLDGTGRVEISFTGSILLHKVDGQVEVSGKLRKEYEGHDRKVYFGTGKIIVVGKWRGIQWFGKDMNAVWYGAGAARLAGEFDKDLNTGKYWYDDPKKANDWLAAGTFTVPLPNTFEQPTVKPVERGKEPPPKKSGG